MASLFQALGLSAAVWLAGCSAPQGIISVECTPIDVQVNGARLVGIEDMARKDANTLLLSAYNRDDEKASPKGLFELDLTQPDRPLKAKRVSPSVDPLTPHGMAYDAGDGQVYVIDRSVKPHPAIKRYDADNAQGSVPPETLLTKATWPLSTPYPCNMNDLAINSDGGLLITNDRSACSTLGKWLDNIVGRANGTVVHLQRSGAVGIEQAELFFPNGVLELSSGDLLVAQTRAKALTGSAARRVISLPGAPDNLTHGIQGKDVWAALVPSLSRYALYRIGLRSALKSSRMSRVSQLEGAAAVVQTYETEDFIGATTALWAQQHLYLSGAYARGIAKCEVRDG